jgi:hypothetical protein
VSLLLLNLGCSHACCFGGCGEQASVLSRGMVWTAWIVVIYDGILHLGLIQSSRASLHPNHLLFVVSIKVVQQQVHQYATAWGALCQLAVHCAGNLYQYSMVR